MLKTVKVPTRLIERFNNEFPEHQLIISIDHSLLVEYSGNNSEVEALTKTAKAFLAVRKRYGSMNIIVGQLNGNIEKDERITRIPSRRFVHFPRKTDFHGSQQIFHASDVVMVVHQPQMLGIDEYGTEGFPTKDLIALHLLKNRKKRGGTFIRLKQELDRGDIVEWR